MLHTDQLESAERILVVDDEDLLRDMMARTLRAGGYLVETAAGGHQALAMLESEPFSLVVTDLKMPDGDGLEVLAGLKKSNSTAEVILVTAHGSLESAVEALRQGAHDYILKPFSLEELSHSVQRTLAYRRLKLERQDILADLQKQSAELRCVLEASNRLARLRPTPDTLPAEIIKIAKQNLSLSVAVTVLEENGELLETRCSPDFQEAWSQLLTGRPFTRAYLANLFANASRLSRSYLIEADQSDIARISRSSADADLSVAPLLAIPLEAPDGRILGVLWTTDVERCLPLEAVQRLEIFANQVTGALENANHFVAQLNQVRARNVLLEAGQRMTTVLDEQQVLHTALNATLKIIPETELAIAYYRPDTGAELNLIGMTNRGIVEDTPSPLNRSLVVEALHNGQTVYQPEWIDSTDQTKKWLIIEPLLLESSRLGALVAIGRRPATCTDDHLQTLAILAHQAAIALQNARLYAEARKLDELGALHEAGQALNRTLNLQETLTTTLTVARALTGASVSNVYLYAAEHHRIDSVVTLDEALTLSDTDRRRSAEIAWDVLARVLDDTDHPLDPSRREGHNIAPATEGEGQIIQTWLTVPLMVSGSPAGILQLGSQQVDGFTPDDVRLVKIIASQAATAIENARLFEDAQQRLRQTEALDTISQSISNTLDIGRVLELVVQSAVKTIPVATHSTLYLLDRVQDKFVIEADVNWQGRPLPPDLEVVREQTIKKAARQYRPVRVAWHSHEHGPWSLMVAPLKEGTMVTGAISVESPRQDAFLSSDERLLNTFANHASIAIQNANLFRELSSAYLDLARHQEEILRSHRTLQALFGGITDGLYIVDRNLRVVTINQAEARRLGATPDALLGRPCDASLWGEASDTVAETVLYTFETGQEGNWESQKDMTKRGPFADRDVRTYPIFKASGEVSQVIIFAQDVSEKRQLQASLFRSANLMAVGQLASSIAHQINNPLTVVIANAQIMQMETETTSPDYPLAQHIVDAGMRISQIVQNLLDFSNQASYEWSKTSLEKTIDDALSFVAHPLRRSTIEVVKQIADLPAITASARHLTLVWVNLLLNARDAILAGEGTRDRDRTVVIRAAETDSDHVEVEIVDDGIGIPLEHRDRLFHPFFTTKPPGQGLGLGLYTCRVIVENHQGQIRIDSDQGGTGTVVSVTLPVHTSLLD
jgi:two-component system NtrC family sensor kinase